jgi:predicted Zn-dependent protease
MAAAMEILVTLEAYKRDHGSDPVSAWTHRVFASHPETGQRLESLGSAPVKAKADPKFVERLDGLEFGSGKVSGIPSGGKLYFPQWDATVNVPDGWIAAMKENKLWLRRKDGKGAMWLERVAEGGTDDLCQQLVLFAREKHVINPQPSSENGVRSCTALARHEPIGIISTDTNLGTRVAYRGFRGKMAENDAVFLSIARSVRPLGPDEIRPKPVVLRIRKIQEGDTFASLAKTTPIPNAEAVLRLLNQRYPAGELEIGQLAKVPH